MVKKWHIFIVFKGSAESNETKLNQPSSRSAVNVPSKFANQR